MKLKRVIPKIFYTNIKDGLELFVECLAFEIAYKEDKPTPFYIIKRDEVVLHLLQDKEFAEKDRPEIRIETDDIEALYNEVKANNEKLLHPNLKAIKAQPWGLKEFALRDKSGVCIIIHQPFDNA